MSKVAWYIVTVILLTILIAIGFTFLSMWIWPVDAANLVRLTGPDGQTILLDANKVSTLRDPRGDGHFAAWIKCLVFTDDGKNVNVAETCDQVRRLLEQSTTK